MVGTMFLKAPRYLQGLYVKYIHSSRGTQSINGSADTCLITLYLLAIQNFSYRSLTLLQHGELLSLGSLIRLAIDTQPFGKQLSPGLPTHGLSQFFGIHPM